MHIKLGAAVLGIITMLAVGPAASAQDEGPLTTTVEVEKTGTATPGQPPVKSYAIPATVLPGDRLRITLTFTNRSATPATGVNIVNPVPANVVFEETPDQSNFSVSTDGGKSFGALASMAVTAPDGTSRPATAADVTHVRWQWPDAVAPGTKRSVVFFGRVR